MSSQTRPEDHSPFPTHLQVVQHFNVDLNQGLTEAQVTESQRLYGLNELQPEPGTPLWKLILKQFDDLLVKILIIAAVVDFCIALVNGESGIGAFIEPLVIILILVANATVGVVTETNAEKAIEELKAYEADVATVLRQGRWTVCPASQLVPGDVVEMAVGGRTPADVRICQVLSTELRIDQSILTGESGSVGKETAAVIVGSANDNVGGRVVAQDKINVAFSGTIVTAGRGRGVVIGTGAATAIGKIRDAMAEATEADTPLKKKLDEFGTLLSKVIAVICILVWVVNLPHFNDPLHGSWFGGALYYFKIAVALAVAAIPEGLPAVVTTCLALGTRQMAKRNAIVRTLPSVETLGCTTVICSDKTGTLTTNQMSVVKMAVVRSADGALAGFDVTGTSYAPEGKVYMSNTIGGGGKDINSSNINNINRELGCAADEPALLQLAMTCALCNDSRLQYASEKGTYQRVGEATEVALRVLCEKIGLPGWQSMPQGLAGLPIRERATYCNDHWEQSFRRVSTLEFSRDRKMMSTLCALIEGSGAAAASLTSSRAKNTNKLVMFTKGAPESVLERCTTALTNGGSGGGGASDVVMMTPGLRTSLYRTVTQYAQESALRVLALAIKKWPEPARSDIKTTDEQELTFVGLVAMQDPPRPEVRMAIKQCYDAGIRVVMVTGDNKATAESVSKQINLLSGSVERKAGGGKGGDDNGDDDTNMLMMMSIGQAHSPDQYKSLSGIEFDALQPDSQEAAAQNMTVFSRVEPSHKSTLVSLLQRQGEIVAMTGDGVNDAPALKKADIGIAMGSGTAVAKHASDMVLADDNFATIVAAVAAGRSIYANTKQFIRYMVSSNIGEVVAIFSAAVLGIPECLNPVQLLWVNLVTDGLPATAIGFNKPDGDIMKRPPRRPTEGIVDRWLFARYMIVGMYVGIATAGGFVWWYLWFEGGPQMTWHQLRDFQHCITTTTTTTSTVDGGTVVMSDVIDCAVFRDSRGASTVAMSVLVIVEMFNALNALSENCSLLVLPPWSNPWLLGAIAVSVILHLIILYTPPLALMFSVVPLSWVEWKMVLVLSAPVVLVDEVLKCVTRRHWGGFMGGNTPGGIMNGGGEGISGDGGMNSVGVVLGSLGRQTMLRLRSVAGLQGKRWWFGGDGGKKPYEDDDQGVGGNGEGLPLVALPQRSNDD
jgi:P-type Ca2+ transporter type 2A